MRAQHNFSCSPIALSFKRSILVDDTEGISLLHARFKV